MEITLIKGEKYLVERVESKTYDLDPKSKYKKVKQEMKLIDETETLWIFNNGIGTISFQKTTPSDQLVIKEIRRKH